ncbi:MAG: tryptophan-rich sensory protein [Spirochaetes bacterium]|nr:tryptophan-rich sensory protein [Spirochaetota bacterium]
MRTALVNLAAFFVMAAVNVCAGALPINGMTTGAISDLYPNPVVPAGYTFSIWGVIYLLLGASALQGVIQAGRGGGAGYAKGPGALFALSSLLNASWIFAWHYRYPVLSLLVMLGLLATLVLIYAGLKVAEPAPLSQRFFLHAPFGIYLGWISVAAAANAAAAAASLRWDVFGPAGLAISAVAVTVCTLVALAVLVRFRDPAYSLAVAWAMGGILARRLSETGQETLPVAAAAASGLAVLALALALQALRGGFYRRGSTEQVLRKTR